MQNVLGKLPHGRVRRERRRQMVLRLHRGLPVYRDRPIRAVSVLGSLSFHLLAALGPRRRRLAQAKARIPYLPH